MGLAVQVASKIDMRSHVPSTCPTHPLLLNPYILPCISVPLSALPLWKQVFVNYTSWSGQYRYSGQETIACRLQVLSVMREEGGIVYAEFRDSASNLQTIDTELQFEGTKYITFILTSPVLCRATCRDNFSGVCLSSNHTFLVVLR